jgi:hypothetical protein
VCVACVGVSPVPVTWDGFDGIQSAVLALLTSGFYGISMSHSDIGGCVHHLVPGPLRLPWALLCVCAALGRFAHVQENWALAVL